MAAPLPKSDRQRLGKLLGMLGSDFPGERDAAGLAAVRLVQASGLTWQKILAPPAIEKPIAERGVWRQTARDCLAKGTLRAWERTFLTDLLGFRRIFTKQRYCLEEIADRVLERAA